MSKFVFLAVLSLLLVEDVLSLSCWITDPKTMIGRRPLLHEKKSCAEAFRFTPEFAAKLDLKCYSLKFPIDRMKLEVKTCSLSGACYSIIDFYKDTPAYEAGDVACSECGEDYCNSDI